MTNEEIVQSYREAKLKSSQIKILSELSLKSPAEIREILSSAGEILPEPRKKKPGRPKVKEEFKNEPKEEPENAAKPHNYSVPKASDDAREELIKIMRGLDIIMAEIQDQKAAIIDYLLEGKK